MAPLVALIAVGDGAGLGLLQLPGGSAVLALDRRGVHVAAGKHRVARDVAFGDASAAGHRALEAEEKQ